MTDGLRLWLEGLDVAWPAATVLVELDGAPFDFPFDAIPSAVTDDCESIELSVRPRGGDTVFNVTVSYDDELFVKVASSEPHPDINTWDGSLRRSRHPCARQASTSRSRKTSENCSIKE